MLRLDNASVTLTSSRGGNSSFGGGKKSFTRVNFPTGISQSESVFFFIVFHPASPVAGTENPYLVISPHESDGHDAPLNHPDIKEPSLRSTVLGIRVHFPVRIQKCSGSGRKIDPMFANVLQLLSNIPNKVAGIEIHYPKYNRNMDNMNTVLHIIKAR